MQQHFVMWDGTNNRPGGKYLSVQTEREHAAKMRPYRTIGQLSDDDIADILMDAAAGCSVQDIADAHHVHTSTVDHIVSASRMGVLRRKSA